MLNFVRFVNFTKTWWLFCFICKLYQDPRLRRLFLFYMTKKQNAVNGDVIYVFSPPIVQYSSHSKTKLFMVTKWRAMVDVLC